MFSILYTHYDEIYKLGPFATEELAMAAAKKASADGEFDIDDQHVYLLNPVNNLIELGGTDLG